MRGYLGTLIHRAPPLVMMQLVKVYLVPGVVAERSITVVLHSDVRLLERFRVAFSPALKTSALRLAWPAELTLGSDQERAQLRRFRRRLCSDLWDETSRRAHLDQDHLIEGGRGYAVGLYVPLAATRTLPSQPI
jgi:hypothetical protein